MGTISVHKDNRRFKDLYGILLDGNSIFSVPEAFNCIGNNPKSTPPVLTEVLKKCSAIGEGAFRNTNIQYLAIPKNINNVFYRAFENCSQLKEIHFQHGGDIRFFGIETFSNCTNLKLIKLPDGIQIIGYKAFNNCSSLRVIYIPATIWRIKSEAFCKCDNLQLIIFLPSKNQIRHIEDGTNIALPNNDYRIVVPSSEIEYFKRVLRKHEGHIHAHQFI